MLLFNHTAFCFYKFLPFNASRHISFQTDESKDRGVKYEFKCEIWQRKRFHLTIAFVVWKFGLISFLQFNLDIIHFHWTSFLFIHLDEEQAAMANIKYFIYRTYRIGIVVYTCFGTSINIRNTLESVRETDPWMWFFSYTQKHI